VPSAIYQVRGGLDDEEHRSDHEEEHLFSAGDSVAKAGVVVVRENGHRQRRYGYDAGHKTG
jgi:hypothetical protein